MDSFDGEALNGGASDGNQGFPSVGGSGFPTDAASPAYPTPPSARSLGPQSAGYHAPSQPFGGSRTSNPFPSFSTMDLNTGNPWPDMDAYAAYIRSSHKVNAVQSPPPIRLPSQSIGPSSGGQGPRSVAEEGGGGTGTGARGRRGISARVRGPGITIGGDNIDSAWITPPPPPPRGRTVGKTRADWTPERTCLFCHLYYMQIDNDNCTMGVMSKAGRADIRSRFFAATGVMHTTEQFASRFRNLRKEWHFCNLLHFGGFGLGRDANGTLLPTTNGGRSTPRYYMFL